MKVTHPITTSTAEYLVLLYDLNRATLQLSRDLHNDWDTPPGLRTVCTAISVAAGDAMKKIERGVTEKNKANFEAMVKASDPLILPELMRLYSRMNPEQKQMAELCFQGILNGEIKIELTPSL